jgi:hypothetical protein
MSDIKAKRYFEIEDFEADEGNGPTKLHVTVQVERPEGDTETYDVRTVLESLCAQYQINVKEVQTPSI